MNEKISPSSYNKQNTFSLSKSNSDSIPVFKKNSTTSIQQNGSKVLVVNNLKNDVNSNQPKDSVETQPQFMKIRIDNKSLIDNYKEVNPLSSNQDSNCYIVNKQIHKNYKPIFYSEKSESKEYIKKDFVVKEKTNTSNDWTIAPILLGLFLLASIVSRYRKYLNLLFESIIFRISSNKILNEKNSQVQRLTIILDIIYVIAFSLTMDQIIKGLGFFSPPQKLPFLVFVVFLGFFIILRLFRLIVFRLSAIFSNHKAFFKELFNSSLLYTRSLGLFLVPLVVLVTYSTGTINLILIYFSVFIIFIMLILRIISMFRVFIVGGFSIFYFILYLCALEILPLLVIWKEVKSR